MTIAGPRVSGPSGSTRPRCVTGTPAKGSVSTSFLGTASGASLAGSLNSGSGLSLFSAYPDHLGSWTRGGAGVMGMPVLEPSFAASDIGGSSSTPPDDMMPRLR